MSEGNNKNWIMYRAMCLFSKKGYDGVGMAEICEESQVSKPTVYYYFQNKQGLLEAILKTYGDKFCEKLEVAAVFERDFIKSLTNLMKAQIEYAQQNSEFFRFYLSLDCNTYDDMIVTQSLSNLRYRVYRIYADLFYKAAETFGNMRGQEDFYSNIFKSIAESTTKQVLNNDLKTTDELIYKTVKCFVYGCAN